MKTYPSDPLLPTVNASLGKALEEYLPDTVTVRFDMPDPDDPPADPTISAFLYDIQEDLQLRHGESRQFIPASGKMAPGTVLVRCCYLFTYWDKQKSSSSDGPASGPGSQAMVVMNQVLNALVNNRHFADLPGSYTRVIPPSEQLNSLGNFWQSLGNKPRLCLSFAVTVPLRLTDKTALEYAPIREFAAGLENKPALDVEAAAGQALWETLVAQLRVSAPPGQAIRAQLAKVVIACAAASASGDGAGKLAQAPARVQLGITLSGVTTAALREAIGRIVDGWPGSAEPVCVLQGVEVFVEQVDCSALVGVGSESRA